MNKAGFSVFVVVQYLLPKRLISSLVFRLTRLRLRWFKNLCIRAFCRLYPIRMDEALKPKISDYASFNEFFTRELRPGVRSLGGPAARILCPVDGTVSQAGQIDGQRVLQAKGRSYTLAALLGDAELAAVFDGGSFATVYLAPCNYHRVHMPIDGTLLSMRYLPGKFFSVNPSTVSGVDGLFARNERIVCEFATAVGRLVQILVGAFNVGSMATVWAGDVTPRKERRIDYRRYDDERVRLARGAEMGRFNMGSTVIVLFARDAVRLDPAMAPGQAVELGQTLALASAQARPGVD
ncbi:MAG: phosphatidylserine decarboxylase [Proteobacteria bacterium]|nr:phosphatidylserine decarboxylase [Pseudomonadota bacterium]